MVLCALCMQEVIAQGKRPNILLILADDMGYSDVGCYGGEVQTPHIDQLADKGLRYKQFYNAARCCPTRAALMTGLYPHQAGMGWMAAADMGTPAYQGNLNNTSVTIAEVLKQAGYSTYMTGKWHLTNDRKVQGEVKDNWPLQRGYDKYFGIVPGGSNYFTPTLYSGNEKYSAPSDFYLTNAISDTSVAYLKHHFTKKGDKPFFMYVAYTSPHWPLHALQKDIDKYREAYRVGWDSIRNSRFARQKKIGLFGKSTTMNPRDPDIPAWDEIPDDKKEEMAMRMAIYAAQVDIMDQGIGRIIAQLKESGEYENTLVFFLSDNGACAEFISSGKSKKVDGTADTFESYRINWANVSSTPFKEYKHYTYEGGIATPFIVHWPGGLAKELEGKFTDVYGEVMDIMTTCVDVSGAQYPSTFKGNAITPMQGKSLLPVIQGEDMDRGKIFWEHEANIALRDGKWKMVAKTEPDQEFDKKTLHLYDLESDPTEMNNLAAQFPEKLDMMYQEWEAWGKKTKVFPMNTQEYGERMSLYRKTINGEFDDNLGGWHLQKNQDVEAVVTTDLYSRLQGKNSLSIKMQKTIDKPAGLMMNWGFNAGKGERYTIDLKGISTRQTSFIIKLESLKKGEKPLFQQTLTVGETVSDFSFTTPRVREAGRYRLALYLGGLKKGDEVWVDGIQLKTMK